MAACEIPLAAASVLKSSSHAWKLPVPQGAASAGGPDIIMTALRVAALKRQRKTKEFRTESIRLCRGISSGAKCRREPRPKQGFWRAPARTRMSTPSYMPNRRSAIDRRSGGNHLTDDLHCGLCTVLAPPWKQSRREIRRGTPLTPRARRNRPGIGIRRDDLAIEMPGGVAEQRDDDGEAEEGRE